VSFVDGQRRRETTPTDTFLWTVGDPGPAALIFPSPQEVDRGQEGSLTMRPTSSTFIYAKSVTVPGVNHTADVMGYVTDAKCIALDDVPVTFEVRLPEFGTVNPVTVRTQQGVAQTTFEAGVGAVPNEAGTRGQVNAFVGEAPPGPGESAVSALAQFQIVGPADQSRMRVIVNPNDEINILEGEQAGITVEVQDRNGNDVADGTAVTVRLKRAGGQTGAPPAALAYDRVKVSCPASERDPATRRCRAERVTLGAEAALVTDDGDTRVRVSDDPGYDNMPGLYLYGTATGEVLVCAEADGQEKCTPNGLLIVSKHKVFLPLLIKDRDILATPGPRATIPPATPTPRS
jgi:hypothetical protein